MITILFIFVLVIVLSWSKYMMLKSREKNVKKIGFVQKDQYCRNTLGQFSNKKAEKVIVPDYKNTFYGQPIVYKLK